MKRCTVYLYEVDRLHSFGDENEKWDTHVSWLPSDVYSFLYPVIDSCSMPKIHVTIWQYICIIHCYVLIEDRREIKMRETNQTVLQRWEDELPQSKVYWMLIAIVAAQAWTLYLTYYNSRILGLILTAILNKFIKYGDIRLGKTFFIKVILLLLFPITQQFIWQLYLMLLQSSSKI